MYKDRYISREQVNQALSEYKALGKPIKVLNPSTIHRLRVYNVRPRLSKSNKVARS